MYSWLLFSFFYFFNSTTMRNSILSVIGSLSIILFISACKTTTTQTSVENTNEITQALETLLSKSHEAGMFNGTALVVKDGKKVFTGAYGISNISPETPMKVENIFRLASVSKQFTCMGIMMLKEQGKLTYDQDVRDFIPELPYEGITLRHLMQHTSGIPDYVTLFEETWKTDLAPDDPAKFIEGNEHIIAYMAEKKPEIRFEPGEKREYSNMAYITLATVVARVSGMSFADFAKQHMFDPLEMNSSSFYTFVPGPDPNMPLRVYGYSTNKGGTKEYNDSNYLNPAQGDGGLYSTVEDLYKWDRALYTEKLVKKATLEEAFAKGKLKTGEEFDYGFGWFIDQSLSGKKVVGHSGGWVGFRTHIHREIEEDNCIILLTNDTSEHLEKVLTQIQRILHGQDYEVPKS